MFNRSRIRALALIAVAFGTASAAADPPAPLSTLGGEVARLRQLATATAIEGEDWPRVRERMLQRLDAIADEVRAGRELSALERLSDTRSDLLAYVYQGRTMAAGFEAAWDRDREPTAGSPGAAAAGPAALRALAESAYGRVRSYLDASRPYAEATAPEYGLFYLGLARANADFVDLCNRLGAGRASGTPPPARTLDAELAELEARVLAAYQPPRSIDRHRDFIQLNAVLKLAQELNAAGAYLGALYQYADATVRLAGILPPSQPPDRQALAGAASAFRARFERETTDHGIGRMLLERAESALATPPEAESAAGDLELARALLASGLPAYLEALKPREGRSAPSSPAVTVTLVRWPYT